MRRRGRPRLRVRVRVRESVRVLAVALLSCVACALVFHASCAPARAASAAQPEAHVLVLWPQFVERVSVSRVCELARAVGVECVCVWDVAWLDAAQRPAWLSDFGPHERFQQFYGPLRYRIYRPVSADAGAALLEETMLQHKGDGSAIVIGVRCAGDDYREHADKGVINSRMWRLKRALRDEVGGGFSVHSSETRGEAAQDLHFLFGPSADDVVARLLTEPALSPAVAAAAEMPTRVVHAGVRPWDVLRREPLPSSAHEAVHAMLLSDWWNERHRPWNSYAVLTQAVMEPNFASDHENLVRAMLCESAAHVDLFNALHHLRSVQWVRFNSVGSATLASMYVPNNSTWEASVHCSQLQWYRATPAGAERLSALLAHSDDVTTPIVAIAPETQGPFVIVHGLDRAERAVAEGGTRDLIVAVDRHVVHLPHWCW